MAAEASVRATFAEWAWARHHVEWSGYLRPLFLLPFARFARFARFAWRRPPAGLALTLLLLLPTSLFRVPAPAERSPQVLAIVAWRRHRRAPAAAQRR